MANQPDEVDNDLLVNEVFPLSAEIGELLRAKASEPSVAMGVLLTTAGRLAAREAWAGTTMSDAWELMIRCKMFFELGFESERDFGNTGRPRCPN